MPPHYDLVVSGRLQLPDGTNVVGEIGVRGGQIVGLGDLGTLRGLEYIDGGNALVLPGHVDAHVHTRSEQDEGIASTTWAAAAGGATTIVDMPYDDPTPVTTRARFEEKARDVEREAITDVALWATIAKTAGLDEIVPLIEAGATGFKVSTFETDPDRFPRIPDGELYLAMHEIRGARSLIAFHAENDELVRRLTAKLRSDGRIDPSAHSESRPPVAESEAIGRALELAHSTGVRIHICHVSIERGFALVERARRDGVDVTAETCTHYLVLDEQELVRQGARAKINPPLRSAADAEALWRHLAQGRIDYVTSDHVAWRSEHKRGNDIFEAKSGVPGLELTLPLLFSEGVVRRRLPVARLVQILCANPARRLGLWPQKGGISLSADADLVLLDPEATWRIDEQRLATAAGWSPYHGRDVTGKVVRVLVRGETVYENGVVTGQVGHGTVVRPVRPAFGAI